MVVHLRWKWLGIVRRSRTDLAMAAGFAVLVGAACSSAVDPTDVTFPTPESPPTGDVSPPSVAEGDDPLFSLYRRLNPSGPKDVALEGLRIGLPPDSIRPIYSPTIVSPEEADIAPDDLVIGVSIGGESRAYPVAPLVFREMVNDELGGVPILVTF